MLEHVERVRQHHGENLRQYAEANSLQSVAARRVDAVDLLAVEILDRFGIELYERAGFDDGDRHDPGKRPQSDRAHENERPDEVIERAQQIGKAPRAELHRRERVMFFEAKKLV